MPWFAGTDQVDRVGGSAGLGLEGLVDALGDIGRLLVDEAHNAAGVAVKTELGTVVANAADNAAGDFLYVDVGLGANLAGDDDGAGGHEGLAGAASVLHVGRHAVGGDVARSCSSISLARIASRTASLIWSAILSDDLRSPTPT